MPGYFVENCFKSDLVPFFSEMPPPPPPDAVQGNDDDIMADVTDPKQKKVQKQQHLRGCVSFDSGHEEEQDIAKTYNDLPPIGEEQSGSFGHNHDKKPSEETPSTQIGPMSVVGLAFVLLADVIKKTCRRGLWGDDLSNIGKKDRTR